MFRGDMWRRGDPAVILSAGGLVVAVGLLLSLVTLVAWFGTAVFWPHRVQEFELTDGTRVLGPLIVQETISHHDTGAESERLNVKQGNRDVSGIDFRWITGSDVVSVREPADAVIVERTEWGNLHGYLQEVRTPAGKAAKTPEQVWEAFLEAVDEQEVKDRDLGPEVVFRLPGGNETVIRAGGVVHAHRPNDMTLAQRFGHYTWGLWDFIFGEPRESNTEGGIWPAIFGTCMMVLIMSVAVLPLGVIAAVYLHEYAKRGPIVRAVRIAVSNLAGVPSIVFGLFGLGFFVYAVGGTLDQLLFSDSLPTPTFGTGGILWASLTLALLTLPVVIVATEESLAAVPTAAREGALALGATRWEVLRRVVLPGAAPGILTGLILAVARGAGEVAPLMLTGAVKLAPEMPFDGQAPFLHLDRKFMHLGFHIYDLGFQSPNVEAAKPMVYATTLCLILLVVLLNVTAIVLRGKIRKRLRGSAF